jgi:microcystin degradation protein MlrC
MRIGILGLLHESNTFVTTKTTLDHFKADLFLEGDEILRQLASSHHEIGGFIAGLQSGARLQSSTSSTDIEIVPLVAYRAMPSGPIEKSSFVALTERILRAVDDAFPLDGLLVAAHGAAVAEEFPDADGAWLALIRSAVGPDIPIVATLDPHGNLSPEMVEACTALIAYRSNPHLDQRQRGEEAANLLLQTLRGKVHPVMRAAYPPLVINIERQLTSAEPLATLFQLADRQLQRPGIIGNSIFLGFPYSDVPKMGAAVVAISDGDENLAQQAADELGASIWEKRADLQGVLNSIAEALDSARQAPEKRFCLLDMGDNVGGGSAGDGTTIAQAILKHPVGPAFICTYDPEIVALCMAQPIGATIQVLLGGKTDSQHGNPLDVSIKIIATYSGTFRETQPRHGGIVEFDQGPTVVAQVIDSELTLMITSKRMVPFSLEQLRSCQIDPRSFHVLVAKGVHAPVAAYREVCDEFLRVNTPGSTCADLFALQFHQRRRPLFPFEG